MAIDFTGINNENEFYTNHYLSAIFENDVKDVLSCWKQNEKESIRPPYKLIRTICKDYFSFTNNFEKEKLFENRIKLQRQWLQIFLPTLGYNIEPSFKNLDIGFDIPILSEIKKNNGAPEMWVIEGINSYGDDSNPLSLSFRKEQFQAEEMPKELLDISLDAIITKFVFSMAEPPRWVIVVNDLQVILLDRSKWNKKRMLRFDISEILGRKEDSTLKAMAVLLHRNSICPDDEIPLLDILDENSHKHAFSVSEDLKYALREAIELIGNEAIYYLQEVRRKGVYSGEEKIDSRDLTRECLRYMYRLLFVLYIEARPELGYAPMNSDAYRLGYSFESLRDLEIIKLNSEESKNGYYINESMQLLFSLIYNGLSGLKQQELNYEKSIGQKLFEIPPLKNHLFDPERTPIINKVKFRNKTLQRVVELMSLSRKGNRNSRRGRISYAQLGINQLGAVYEALLSYQGFFAQTDLFEVKKANEAYDELKNAYFVKAEDLEKYSDDEKVYNSDGTLRKYIKGTFIYRLAGRDREKSASYYTPEVLTKCLVKYALKELLKDKNADDILGLTVCEPAMGSAAFLNESINQLAEAYLDRKQMEIGERIEHDKYAYERQKIKMYLADNNVFGIDLNPVAVELAEVSLWLNTISKENFVPWFGMQLVCGNSLIGARRQVFGKTSLRKENRVDSLWLDEVPERVMPGQKRNANTIYHFLLPDKGMANYKDKVIKQLAGDDIKKINNWRKNFTKEFSKNEIKTLQELSVTIDKLWSKHTEQQRDMRKRTTDVFNVWGQEKNSEKKDSTGTRWKDKVLEQELLSKKVRNSSPYRRIKLAMDYWCSLWFWPIDKAELLPSREQYLLELSLILEGNPIEVTSGSGDQLILFSDTMSKQMQMNLVDEFGIVDIDKLCSEVERLVLVKELAEKYRFLHWELEYSDIFNKRGGFDLVLGNPPWIKVTWRKEGILSEFEPLIDIKNYTAPKIESSIDEIIKSDIYKIQFYQDFIDQTGTKNFFKSKSNYPFLVNLQSNLYKCFLVNCWSIGSCDSVVALMHEAELLSGIKGVLKKETYKRLCSYWQFQNELNLFKDVLHTKKFAATISKSIRKNEVKFYQIVNLFHPKTVDLCFCRSGKGKVPGIKTEDNKWSVEGHRNRIVEITKKELNIFKSIFEEDDVDDYDVRLLHLHSVELLNVIKKLSGNYKKTSDLKRNFTEMFDETGAQNSKLIIEEIGKVQDADKVILSGPHIYNCNLLYQEVPENYKNKQDYELIDLNKCGEKYYQRTVYKIGENYSNSIKKINSFRNARRKMAYSMAERTLVTAIIPPEVKHINSIISEVFENNNDLITFTGLTNSIIYDFFVKIIGKTNLTSDVINILPFIDNIPWQVSSRVLRLSCITCDYEDLWNKSYINEFSNDKFTKKHNSFSEWTTLSNIWSIEVPLRNYLERRQALLEIDVMIAIVMGISFKELCSIYRIQFPIFHKNEKATWYDQKGTIVYSVHTAYSKINRKDILEKWDGKSQNEIEGYLPPFELFDREKDYEIAWKEFERRFKDKKDTK